MRKVNIFVLALLILTAYTAYLLVFSGDTFCYGFLSPDTAEGYITNNLCSIQRNLAYILKALILITLVFEIFAIYKIIKK